MSNLKIDDLYSYSIHLLVDKLTQKIRLTKKDQGPLTDTDILLVSITDKVC